MNYRIARTEDTEQIFALCTKHDIKKPEGFVIVAELDGEIKGIAGLEMMIFFEPLISEVPGVGAILQHRIESFAQAQNTKFLYCMTDEDKEDLFTKAGYTTVENKKIIMRKEL